LQHHQARQLFLKTQIFPVARRQRPHQVRLPNRKGSCLLKMLRPTYSRPHTSRSPNGWRVSSGSILMLNSIFLHSMSPICRSDHCSAVEQMQIRLGKAQLVKAIDDGGISMYFRRDPASSRESQRVVLSVEVAPFITLLTNPGQTEKARKGKRWRHCKSPCCAIICRNAWSSMSFGILWRAGQWISRGILTIVVTNNSPL